jgi:hypothetical protein
MQLHIDWLDPLPLSDGSDQNLIYACELEDLPAEPGIYIFGRRHGSSYIEALYVGKANNSVRARVKTQLKNLPLMMHLQNAKTGGRIVWAGIFTAKRGQQRNKCLLIIERAMIRYFLSEAHDLVNKQGTRIRRHEITTAHAKGRVPKLIFVDR